MTTLYTRQDRNTDTGPANNPIKLQHAHPEVKATLSGTSTLQFIAMVKQRFPRFDEHKTTKLDERAVSLHALGELRQLYYLAEKAGLHRVKAFVGKAYVAAFEAVGAEAASLVLEGRKSNVHRT